MLLLCAVFFSAVVCPSDGRLFLRGRSFESRLDSEAHDELLPPAEWFQQTLDHFNPQDQRTWRQRFFRNDTFYKKGGPVFLMVGGEGEASAKWMVNGTWITYAQTFNALCFQLEHRFYGQSRPTEDLSVESLEYLSSEQALADLAAFIVAMNKDLPNGTRWILFGGSYPGSLAAWARSRYPHLVHAAMSASGPLLAVADFKDYYKVVEEALGPNCSDAVATAQRQLTALLSRRAGQRNAYRMFRLCTSIQSNQLEDFQNFYETLASNFAGIVQYNKDNRLTPSNQQNITIDVACKIMTNKENFALQRLADLSNLLLDANNQTCLDFGYDSTVAALKNESWESTMSEGGRQWTYQTCTEFGFFQTSTREETQRLFGQFPLSLFLKQCSDIFGPKFTPELLQQGIDRTNIEYGGLAYKADRVVFVHGSVDPWHALGITTSLGPRTPAIYINGTAHCANMYPPKESDLPQLTAARQAIQHYLSTWLQEP